MSSSSGVVNLGTGCLLRPGVAASVAGEAGADVVEVVAARDTSGVAGYDASGVTADLGVPTETSWSGVGKRGGASGVPDVNADESDADGDALYAPPTPPSHE